MQYQWTSKPCRTQVNDLPTLDAELYRSLMFLRDYDGDAADLSLTFSITDDDLGGNREVFDHKTICSGDKRMQPGCIRLCSVWFFVCPRIYTLSRM